MRESLSPEGAEEVLGSQEAWYRFVMDRLPLGVITVDHDRRVTYINPHGRELTGWTTEQALGSFCGDVLKGGQCRGQCPLKSVIEHRSQTVDLRSTLTNRAGETIPIRFRTVALYDENEELIGAVEAFFDISRTVALEEERDRTLSYFAHDMKSPLSGAIGFMERLLAGKVGEMEPRQTDYLGRVRDQLMRVQELVGDYLDVLRLGSARVRLILDRVDLGALLEELADCYRRTAEDRGLGWSLDLAEGLPPVRADRNRLWRAIANVMDNAVKFSRSGNIEVSCEPIDGGQLRVLVCDQGPGLSPEDLQRLFTPFFRGSAGKEAEGTGLGLAAVKAIIEAHGGRVIASNRETGGACFGIFLPISADEPPADQG